MCTAKAIPEPVAMTEKAKDSILRELAQGPSRPTELLAKLGDKFTDFELKEAVLRLLQDGAIVFTSDRRLQVKQEAA